MRSTLIGGLVEILQNNLNCKQNRVRVFEIARVFGKGSDGLFVQNERIGGLWYGAANARTMGRENAQCGFLRHQGRCGKSVEKQSGRVR